jgi:hypothetical protein
MLTNCADSTRRPDEPRTVEIASILAAAVLRLRRRESVPNSETSEIPIDSSPDRLELSRESLLSIVYGSERRAHFFGNVTRRARCKATCKRR